MLPVALWVSGFVCGAVVMAIATIIAPSVVRAWRERGRHSPYTDARYRS